MYIFIGKINQIKSNDMKKFFTLTLLLCAAAIANAAPATIFSLTVTAAPEETVKFSTSDINFSDYADITGGTVEVISTSGEISKSSIVLYKGTIIKVTLDGGNKLQAGDIISFSALADGAEDLAKDVNIFPTEKRTTDIKTMNEYTVTDEDLIHGLEHLISQEVPQQRQEYETSISHGLNPLQASKTSSHPQQTRPPHINM